MASIALSQRITHSLTRHISLKKGFALITRSQLLAIGVDSDILRSSKSDWHHTHSNPHRPSTPFTAFLLPQLTLILSGSRVVVTHLTFVTMVRKTPTTRHSRNTQPPPLSKVPLR
ncbi:hypothetical protein PIB30_098494 [Stylosanthes scabra]|uniref:Uncharacterized protein n=1 Tax=Stylosanthes scabra TaxID=79078 RepID=A0ABU6UXQ4_9FABA|nr:hypothetical protein [Stylosanthes scabra]